MDKKRSKHKSKELEAILKLLESHGWTVEKTTYFRCECPCGEHLKWVALTPSGSRYTENLLAWFTRQSCWPKE